MPRITINSHVSTECWRFDKDASNDSQRWSYLTFGENWRDCRLHGTVKGRGGGDKWIVEWDVDGTTMEISTEYLCQEDTSLLFQVLESQQPCTSTMASDMDKSTDDEVMQQSHT